MRAAWGIGLGVLLGCGALPVAAEAPLSAIGWLSESVATPPPAPVAARPPEPPVTMGAVPDDVSTSVIGAPSIDGAGVLAPKVTGLPPAMWGLTPTDQIIAAVTTARTDALPELASLLITLLLAESEPPPDAGTEGRLFLARVDKLLALGALEQAAALLALVRDPAPEVFRRSFDVALLTGNEDIGCAEMQSIPALAPTLSARIFCLARTGDWSAAALTLESARALDQVTAEQDALLSRFLDAELTEETPTLPPPDRMTPLDWRIYEAIGETFPTTSLSIAFAHAELRETAGWKAQLDAAERLARAGAIAPNRLLGLYTDRKAAASGGVWDRVSAFQALDRALEAKDANAVARTLPPAESAMAAAELEVAFANMVQDRLATVKLTGDAALVAFHIGLLSDDYRAVAEGFAATDPTDVFLRGIALGDVSGLPTPDSLGRAIAPAFGEMTLNEEVSAMVADGRDGELVLRAIDRISTGVESDLTGVTEGLAILRLLGLEDAARRTALQLMLLERRG